MRILQLAGALEKATEQAAKVTAHHYETRLEEHGGRFHITSPRGQKVRLDDVDTRRRRGGMEAEFAVAPKPRSLGLWVIVTEGSKPHTILPKGMARKVKRLNNAFASGRRLTRSQASFAASIVTGQGLFAGVKPLFYTESIGPRYVVQHPGHESLGSPWTDGNAEADRSSEKVFDDEMLRQAFELMGR